ncbi:hypothetical protein BaRGS_00015489 [Batillaria attramentaria]|uniref:Ribosomal protein L28 n=1 Tax=Batillaria attramentaria TaxID=370345 RepID=A0ABD0L220_9CAEN
MYSAVSGNKRNVSAGLRKVCSCRKVSKKTRHAQVWLPFKTVRYTVQLRGEGVHELKRRTGEKAKQTSPPLHAHPQLRRARPEGLSALRHSGSSHLTLEPCCRTGIKIFTQTKYL